jgi:hypothetical protein
MTRVTIEGDRFLIDGEPTYPGAAFRGRSLEGLLFNSRMVQAMFDDENPVTRDRWRYPDTGVWDPERNTREFCDALAEYRAHNLLAVTVGLQGGGSIYSPEVFDAFECNAFEPDGSLRRPYFDRLGLILDAADRLGMVVIVNYFYFRQERRFTDETAILRAARNATDWLMTRGNDNVMIDARNEIKAGDGLMFAGGIHRVLRAIREVSGDRIPLGVSTFPMPEIDHLPDGAFYEEVDFLMPHGNNSQPDAWRKEMEVYLADPRIGGRPVLCNEDSHFVENLDVSAEMGISWGYYDQGHGCGARQGKFDWTVRGREDSYDRLSGFQTVPVNWTINTPEKRAFFQRVRDITSPDAADANRA